MNPEIWGPSLWFGLHSTTMAYPFYPDSDQKQKMRNFFLSLQDVLPCMLCREHYKEHLEKHPIDPALESRGDLVRWLVGVHNSVNKSLGKREWSFEEVIQHYEQIYGHPIMIYPGTTEISIPEVKPSSLSSLSSLSSSSYVFLGGVSIFLVVMVFLLCKGRRVRR